MFRKMLFASLGLGTLGCPAHLPVSRRARQERPAGHSLARKLLFAGVGLGVLGCVVAAWMLLRAPVPTTGRLAAREAEHDLLAAAHAGNTELVTGLRQAGTPAE